MLKNGYVLQLAGPTKALQAVAALSSERDGETRKAALNTLATAYKILGTNLFQASYLISVLWLNHADTLLLNI